MLKPAIFLDRDNTLIVNDGDLGDPDAVRLVQGAASAVASLCGLGYKIVVITNQGGVARGKYTEDDVQAVHDRIREQVVASANGARIDAFYYCPYHPDGTVEAYKREHPNRKPAPGMLLEAARTHKLDLGQSWTVGDQPRDVAAGKTAGTRTVLVRDPSVVDRAEGDPDVTADAPDADFTAESLIEAVRIIAQARKPEAGEALGRAQLVERKPPPPRREPPAKRQHKPPPPEEELADDDAEPPPGSKGAAGREFRPWNAPLPRQRERPRPPRKPRPAAADDDTAESAESAESAETAPAPSPPLPTPRSPKSERPPRQPAAEPPADIVRLDLPSDDGDEPPPTPPDPDEPQETDSRMLRLILKELRGQHEHRNEFTYLTIAAIVLQGLVGLLLIMALVVPGEGELGLFTRFLGCGILLQLTVIALMIFDRR